MAEPTVLGGALVRRADGWYWRTGERATTVRDLSASGHYNFRCRRSGSITLVEVPLGRAREEDDLEWVLAGVRAERYAIGQDLDRTGPLVIDEHGAHRMHIRPGEDPLLGHEPLPEQPGPISRVALVPIEEWDRWARETCLGAEWDAADEPSILARARELGWEGNG